MPWFAASMHTSSEYDIEATLARADAADKLTKAELPATIASTAVSTGTCGTPRKRAEEGAERRTKKVQGRNNSENNNVSKRAMATKAARTHACMQVHHCTLS